MKEHEFLAMQDIARTTGQALGHIAEGMGKMVAQLSSLVAQGEEANRQRTEVTMDPDRVRLPILDGLVVGDPGPAASGWVQVLASDGNPVEPTEGSSFKLEGGLLMVCVSQDTYNRYEESLSGR